MNLNRKIPVPSTAWFVLSGLFFLALFWSIQPELLSEFQPERAWLWLPCVIVIPLVGAILLGSIVQDSWMRRSEPRPATNRRFLSASGWLTIAVMAVLSPLLADCLHSGIIVAQGIRLYNAELTQFFNLNFWGGVAAQGLVTAVFLLPVARRPARQRIIWLGTVAGWLCLERMSEVAYK